MNQDDEEDYSVQYAAHLADLRQEDYSDQYAAYLADRRSDAMEEFLMTGRPSALADYLEAQGTLEYGTREFLIDILRNGPQLTNKGGRDSWRDYTSYHSVKSIERLGYSKTEACRQFARTTNQELRAVEIQYDRGAKIYGPDCDLFTKKVGDHEK